MTRKERKHARKNKNKIQVTDDKCIRRIAKILYDLALKERYQNRHLHHKILMTKENKKGCFNASLKICLCSECYCGGPCDKWSEPTKILMEGEDGNYK